MLLVYIKVVLVVDQVENDITPIIADHINSFKKYHVVSTMLF